jgi:hypothetical protein
VAIVVEYKLTGIEVLTRTQVKSAMKRAMRQLGEYWHEAFAWKRFTPLGFSEYGFRARTSKYWDYKAHFRPAAAGLPLVLTGKGREEALSESTKRRIKVTEHSVTIPLPTKFNLSHPHGPKMSDEVRAVSAAEIKLLEENLVLFIEDALDAEVPAYLRNRGEIGGRVESLKLREFRRPRSARSPNPLRRRLAA